MPTSSCQTSCQNGLCPDQPLLWVRFIDDIIIIWTHGISPLNDFIVYVNKCIPSINFSHEISPDKVLFLYTMVTNTHELSHTQLRLTLFTPKLPTSPNRKIFDSSEMAGAIHNYLNLPLCLTSKTGNQPFISLQTSFLGHNVPREIVKKNWQILAKNRRTRNLFDAKIILGNCGPHNLRDHLVTARVKSNSTDMDNSTTLINICTAATCHYCPLLDNSGTITSHFTRTAYMTMRDVGCRCTNLVYCITCKQCGKKYVGQKNSSST